MNLLAKYLCKQSGTMNKLFGHTVDCFPKLLCSSFPQCMDHRQWHPLSALNKNSDEKIALVKLNTAISENEMNCFVRLWENAALRAFADGAINRLYELFPSTRGNYIPDLISGDFDSAQPQILEYYRRKGTNVITTPDQDQSDFTKCLKILTTTYSEALHKVSAIMVHVTEAGRFDHVMGNINTLFFALNMTNLPIYMVSSHSLLCLLPKGRHTLHVESPLRGKHCGLIPIGNACDLVTTTGLQYNLKNQKLKFGGIVSSSNSYDGDNPVTIHTDKPLLWTMELDSHAWSS